MLENSEEFLLWEFKEEKRLKKLHKERYPKNHFKLGDIVSFKSVQNVKFTNDVQLKTYKFSKEICPRKMEICDIEYEDFFGDPVQYLYFECPENNKISIDNRNSFNFDHCREEKIKRILKSL